MTAIVLKDNLFIGDGLVIDDRSYLKHGTCKKIIKLEAAGEKIYWGGSGDASCERPFSEYVVQWYYNTPRARELKTQWLSTKHEFGAIVALPRGIVWQVDEELNFWQADAPWYVDGVAHQLAWGGLAAGMNAIQAIQLCCVHNAACGYPIQGFNIKTHQEIILKDEKAVDKYFKEANNGVPTA